MSQRRKLTSKDQIAFFDDGDDYGNPIPEEPPVKEKKEVEDTTDPGEGSGFLFDLDENAPKQEAQKEQEKPQQQELIQAAEETVATIAEEEIQSQVQEAQIVDEALEDASLVPEPAEVNPSDVVEDALKAAEQDQDELTLAYFASKAYLEYAISVVKGRALPDVSDGLKPVQRRILYSMKRLGLAPESKHVKSARVVGDVLGKYHPHGDSAAYEAMVRMAQDFTLRYPLVDGHGNFGSADGDGAAAMRYTEVRLSRYADLLLGELDQGTVNFNPNYDGAFKEPSLLPARLPILLLNGSTGIAVGMATEIPSHNLKEVAQATIKVLLNPETTLDEVLEVMPGPDLPCGGQLISSPTDIKNAYRTGYGNMQMRAVYHFEELERGQWQLVITELPYKVSAQKVLSEIDSLTNPKPASGKKTLSAKQQQEKQLILNVMGPVRDESSAESGTPIRLVIDPRSRTVDRDELVNTLFGKTSLEAGCKLNMVVIGVDGKPQQKGLMEVLSEWCQFRIKTVKRRCETSLKDVQARIHVLNGRLTIIVDIEEVIRIIRGAEDPKAELMSHFGLSDIQAEDILEIKLRQLSTMDPIKMQKELDKLGKEERRLIDLIENEGKLRKEIAKEIEQDAEKFGDDRRTLIKESETTTIARKVVNEPVTVVISEKGFAKVRGGHGFDAKQMNFKLGDSYRCSFECRSIDNLIILADSGRVYSVPVSQLPSGRGEGTHISAFIQLQDKDKPVDYLAADEKTKVLMASNQGLGFFCTVSDMVVRQKSGKTFFTLEDGAKPLMMRVSNEDQCWVATLSSSGRLVVFEDSEIRTLPSGGKGVQLMSLQMGEELVCALPVTPNGFVVIGKGRGGKIQELSIGPRLIEDYRAKRGRKGRFVDAKWTFLDMKNSKLDEKKAEENAEASAEEPAIDPSDSSGGLF